MLLCISNIRPIVLEQMSNDTSFIKVFMRKKLSVFPTRCMTRITNFFNVTN